MTRRLGQNGHMTKLAPIFALHSGPSIPAIGLGTWPLDDREVEEMCLRGFEIGYRLIDTAENYRNEAGVGKAVRDSGLPREELFVTTKFNKNWHADAVAGVQNNLRTLGLDYADLVLIHWPNPDQNLYVRAWEGLIEARERGLVRAIGTSNFTPAHLDRLIETTGVVPDVNQVQCNPWADRREERAFHAEHGIITESWGPLGAGNGLVEDPLVEQLAAERGVAPGQVVLAWHIQQGLVPIPKSSNPERLASNFQALEVELSDDDITALSELTNPDYGVSDPDRFGH